jgi:hypothetical protein
MRRKSDCRNAVEVADAVKDGLDVLVGPLPGAVGALVTDTRFSWSAYGLDLAITGS